MELSTTTSRDVIGNRTHRTDVAPIRHPLRSGPCVAPVAPRRAASARRGATGAPRTELVKEMADDIGATSVRCVLFFPMTSREVVVDSSITNPKETARVHPSEGRPSRIRDLHNQITRRSATKRIRVSCGTRGCAGIAHRARLGTPVLSSPWGGSRLHPMLKAGLTSGEWILSCPAAT